MGWDAAAGLTAGRAPSLNVSSSLSAASSQNAANADKVDGLDVGCPSGTVVLAAGACFETQKRPASSSLSAAMSDCADEGRYIATLAQLVALQAVIFPGLGLEYTSSIFSIGGFKLFLVDFQEVGFGLSIGDASTSHQYRCVTGPVG